MIFLITILVCASFAESTAFSVKQCPAGLQLQCGTGTTPTCDNYRSIVPTKICLPTCQCPNREDVYNVDTKTCINKSLCKDSDENKKCQADDPNTEYQVCPVCIPGRPCITLYCEPCTCKSGFTRNYETAKCEPSI